MRIGDLNHKKWGVEQYWDTKQPSYRCFCVIDITIKPG